ncbi:multisubunit potassium/proton antiporter, PhaF subunit [Halopseudomonas litoralis]|uniref:Multisubunit potassium/proton antiporter, PhaF subunit n=2 Tax=Halopseudomonas litoralis TaxID=797277 RepID=A0A1H1URG5_9GAMM|nr:multisubunit potassium/proton antiporter, PhaF subunit [Halopseudomonas litoralis]
MIAVMLTVALGFAQLCVMLALIFCAIRLLLGPTAQDRVLALDALWMTAMLFILLLGIRFSSIIYFEAALIIALTGFVSSIALAKFLIRGEIIE